MEQVLNAVNLRWLGDTRSPVHHALSLPLVVTATAVRSSYKHICIGN